MYDHLGLGGEYIVTLFSYLSGKGKNSLRYIERTAVNLFDEGVDTVDALNAYIKRKDEFEDNVGKIRSLIGAGQRELTAKEEEEVLHLLARRVVLPDRRHNPRL